EPPPLFLGGETLDQHIHARGQEEIPGLLGEREGVRLLPCLRPSDHAASEMSRIDERMRARSRLSAEIGARAEIHDPPSRHLEPEIVEPRRQVAQRSRQPLPALIWHDMDEELWIARPHYV